MDEGRKQCRANCSTLNATNGTWNYDWTLDVLNITLLWLPRISQQFYNQELPKIRTVSIAVLEDDDDGPATYSILNG